MQRFAAMSDICDEISKVLDTMFNTEIPSEYHLPALIHKLADEKEIPLALGVRPREVLLGRPTHLPAAGANRKITHRTLRKATYCQGGRQCHHTHMHTCRKGYFGRRGCRLCMKAGRCSKTGRKWLRPLSEEEAEHLARTCKAPPWTTIPDGAFLPSDGDRYMCVPCATDNDDDASEGSTDQQSTGSYSVDDEASSQDGPDTYFCENEGKTISVAFEAADNIPGDLLPETYSVINILQRSKPPPLIVWETARRPAENILHSPSASDPPLTREQIVEQLRQNLDTINEFSEDHSLWQQLRKLSDEDLQQFYRKLVDAFQTANQYIASYNPSISYCTGAHNNAVLLGGDQQAKAATFYLCPYMGKLKFPLQDCLVILQQALKHVQNFHSVATDSGSDERTSKHILQRCLMRMNMQMELSGT